MYDVIVVGAGPAGSTAAYKCARAGLQTLLLEKTRFPREKPCGGAISVRSLNALRLMDIHLPSSLVEREIYGIQFIGPEGIPFDYRSPLLVATTVKRSKFDTFLATQAVQSGANFQQQCPVTGLEQHKDHVVCQTEKGDFTGRLVIGADGANTVIGRKTGLRKPMKPFEIGIAVEADSPVSKSIWNQGLDPTLIVFWLPNIPQGYFWVFPRKHSVSVGLGGIAQQLGNVPNLLRGLSRRFCEQYGLSLFDLKGLRGHMLPVFDTLIPLTNNRVFLVGDSAGFIDAFSGQGICYAIEGGLIAAQTAIKVIKQQEPLIQATTTYRRRIQQRFGEELRMSWVIMRFVHAHLYGGFRSARFMKWTGQLLFDIGRGKMDYYRMRRNPLRVLYNILKTELRTRLMRRF